MQYVVKTPAILGDTCNLAAVAHSMALQRATAGGGWHEKTYEAMMAEYCDWLRTEARSGRLVTSNSLGITTVWNVLMNEDEPSDASDACRLAWVNLGQLNAWAQKNGHVFTVDAEGVPWIDERGVVGGTLPGPYTITIDGIPETVLFKHHKSDDLSDSLGECASDPVAQESQESPVVSRPKPLTTTEIAECFDGLGGLDSTKWKSRLGKQPAWLQPCIVTKGWRGKYQTRWDPVKFGAVLIHRMNAKQNHVRGRFQTRPPLNPWLREWQDFEYQLPASDKS